MTPIDTPQGSWNQAFWSLLLAKVLLGKDEVAGSNPAISSIKPVRNDWFSYAFGRFLQDLMVAPCKSETSSVRWTGFVRRNVSFCCFQTPENHCAIGIFSHLCLSVQMSVQDHKPVRWGRRCLQFLPDPSHNACPAPLETCGFIQHRKEGIKPADAAQGNGFKRRVNK